MSLWEIAVCAQAWARSQGVEEELKPFSAERDEELRLKHA